MFLFVLLSMALIALCNSSYNFSSTELDALWALYNSTNGDHWMWYDNTFGQAWNFSVPSPNPCTSYWQGISCSSNCDSSPCTVTRLDLSLHSLRGTIPYKISELTNLEHFWLRGNHLTGTIPPEFGSLSSLKNVSLEVNLLSGSIPTEIFQITSLHYLVLSVNLLCGSLSSDVSNLVNLKELGLEFNRLVGSIPATVGQLTLLERFHLDDNKLTGSLPSEMGNMSNLVNFYVRHNNMTGTIPNSFGNLTNMIAFCIEFNSITGTVPTTLGNLVNMRYFMLDENLLTGNIPDSLTQLTSLEHTFFDYNFFTGTIPSGFGTLTTLTQAFFDNNMLHGTIPSDFGQLTNLGFLYLSVNCLTGTIPPELGKLSLMLYLLMFDNSLIGTIPTQIGLLTNMQYFSVNINNLNGTLPNELGNLSRLNYFYLDDNYFSGTIPSTYTNLQSLLHLSFTKNLLTGPIDTILTYSFSNMTLLNLRSNLFSGVLPSISNFLALQQLELQDNLFTGHIQFELFTLEDINIASNQFSGCFPWLDIQNLKLINVSENLFSCSLDHIQISSSTLQTIDVSNTFMYGSIGSFFQQFSSLSSILLNNNFFSGSLDNIVSPDDQMLITDINIAYNQFTGTLPTSLFACHKIRAFVATGNCLHGSIPDNICSALNLTTLVLDGMGSSLTCNPPLFSEASKQVYIANSDIASMLPICLFQDLHVLDTLHLSGIGLTGTLPDIATLPRALKYFSVSYNSLTGTIPQAFFDHEHWADFDVSFNRIVGTLSNFASRGADLSLLLNRLSGNIPNSVREMNTVDILSGNIFSCQLDSNSQLPPNDPNVNSYQCGSNNTILVFYIWLSCFVIVLIVISALVFRLNSFQKLMQLVSLLRATNIETNSQNGVEAFKQITKHWLFVCVYLSLVSLVFLMPLYVILSIHFHTYEFQYAWTVSACFMAGQVPATILMVVFVCLLGYYTRQSFHSPIIQHTQRSILDTPVKLDKITSYAKFHFASVVISSAAFVIVINGLYVYALDQHVNSSYIFLIILAISSFKVASNNILLETSLISKTITTYVLIALLCFNNVIVPFLTESFVSTNCFYYAILSSSPDVETKILLKKCQLVFNTEAWVYDKPFQTVYLLCYPTLQEYSYQPPFVYSYTCSASLIQNFSTVFLLRFLISGLVEPLLQWILDKILRRLKPANKLHILLSSIQCDRWSTIRILETAPTPDFAAAFVANMNIINIYDHRKFASGLSSDMLMLLTFGVLFPPLAFAIMVSIFVTIVDHRLTLHKFVKMSTSEKVWQQALFDIEVEVRKTDQLLRRPVPFIAVTTALFWSFTLFDTIGDSIGGNQAVWIIPVMFCIPLVWHAFWMWYYWYCNRKTKMELDKRSTTSVQANPMVVFEISANDAL